MDDATLALIERVAYLEERLIEETSTLCLMLNNHAIRIAMLEARWADDGK